MDREGGARGGFCYYKVLLILDDASPSEIRSAYLNLALKWHPDKWAQNPGGAAEAKRRFQQIQEAYSVLSNQSKKSLYDAGLYDPLEEEDEDCLKIPLTVCPNFFNFSKQEFCDFMQEMISMMNNVKDEGDSFEDLQKMFVEMLGGSGVSFDLNDDAACTRRARVTTPKGISAKRSISCC